MRYILFILFFLLTSEVVLGQNSIPIREAHKVRYDLDSPQEPLALDESKIEDYKNDPDFNYEPQIQEENWWSKTLDWLSDVWNGFWRWAGRVWRNFWELLLGDADGSAMWSFVINILPWIILATLLAFIVWLFYKLNPGAKLLHRRESAGVFFSEEEEIIKSRNIKKLIEKAIQDQNYRLAVRYHYLFVLQQLTERDYIDYAFDKTNSDYFSEIQSPEIHLAFRKATILYDYIWYGNFTVTQEDFSKALNTFTQLEHKLEKR